MIKKRLKKVIVAMSIASLLGAGGLIAQAGNHSFGFSFGSTEGTISTGYHAKTDNDSNWYISLDKKNGNNKNTLSSSNIFGCRIHRQSNDNVGTYHTFSNYVSGYALEYRNAVNAGDNMKLTGKKDDSSTSAKALKVSGRFAP